MKRSLFLLCCVLLLLLASAAPASAGPRTFVVTLSGTDDTASLQQAFDDMATGPGSVVRLTAGEFYTNEILVDGFDGCSRAPGCTGPSSTLCAASTRSFKGSTW